jgi:hypothetical protein
MSVDSIINCNFVLAVDQFVCNGDSEYGLADNVIIHITSNIFELQDGLVSWRHRTGINLTCKFDSEHDEAFFSKAFRELFRSHVNVAKCYGQFAKISCGIKVETLCPDLCFAGDRVSIFERSSSFKESNFQLDGCLNDKFGQDFFSDCSI